eukprot:2667628-Rhodomonas_salina.2
MLDPECNVSGLRLVAWSLTTSNSWHRNGGAVVIKRVMACFGGSRWTWQCASSRPSTSSSSTGPSSSFGALFQGA